ncbi:MAG: CopD family protein [Gemmatimonadetes bacterium]|nr:CopD family protein [Gemmatimonadota bacterium]
MVDAAGGWFEIAARFGFLTGTTTALGAWVFRRFVVPRAAGSSDATVADALRHLADRAAVFGLALLALSASARLTAWLASGATAVSSAASAVGVIDPPRVLMLQIAAALVALSALLTRGASRAWPAITEGALVVLAVTPPFLAHAGSAAEWRAVAVAVDITHLVAAGAWVGALALVTWAAALVRREAEGPARMATLIAAFHPIAVIAAPTVFATGLLTAWLRMGVPEGIAAPTYSGLFVAKLLLVGATGYIGIGHSKIATKRLKTVPADATWRSLLLECAFAVAVLVVTAVLVGTAPIAE